MTKGAIGMKKTALVLEGGAMRSLYTSGVLDIFMESQFLLAMLLKEPMKLVIVGSRNITLVSPLIWDKD